MEGANLCLNDDPERLQALPPLDPDVRDKITVVKVCKRPMPMTTGTTATDELFWRQMVSELPAFIDFLDHWQKCSKVLGLCKRPGTS